MSEIDLRILALTDTKTLPLEVQTAFDHWRIWTARDAVVAVVRRRLTTIAAQNKLFDDLPTLNIYLSRLEYADTERNIFEGIYALASTVEVYREHLGLHSNYIVLIMSSHLNPWGLLEFNQDFDTPPVTVNAAAQELWRLVREHKVDIQPLLAKIKGDATLDALQLYYQNHGYHNRAQNAPST